MRSMSERIRSFIAIEIEEQEVLSKIIKIKNSISDLGLDIKPVEDENIHITIRFLGEITFTTLNEIKNILNNTTKIVKPFTINIKGIGAFPNTLRPRVIWVGITEGFDNLIAIRKYIDNEVIRLKLIDVYRDRHEFSPHITIARVKSLRNIDRFIEFYQSYKDFEFGISHVSKIKLKQSILTPRGPIYKDIHVVNLM